MMLFFPSEQNWTKIASRTLLELAGRTTAGACPTVILSVCGSVHPGRITIRQTGEISQTVVYLLSKYRRWDGKRLQLRARLNWQTLGSSHCVQ